MFKNRTDAGQRLAVALADYKNAANTIVAGVPRGGVVPAAIVAHELNLPLDLVMVKKIGHPTNSEYAIGAVSMDDAIVNTEEGVSKAYLQNQIEAIQKKLKERYADFTGNNAPGSFTGKTVIVIDDGIATGFTLMAAIELIKKQGAEKVLVAVPVGPPDSIKTLGSIADEVICLEEHEPFYAIGTFYESFNQVPDDEVKSILNKFHQ